MYSVVRVDLEAFAPHGPETQVIGWRSTFLGGIVGRWPSLALLRGE